MEKKIIEIPVYDGVNKVETIKAIEVGKMRFYDEEDYWDWKYKYEEPKIKKKG
jgi:hypothetical protein